MLYIYLYPVASLVVTAAVFAAHDRESKLDHTDYARIFILWPVEALNIFLNANNGKD